MLVLRRKIGESIVIGETMMVSVLAIEGKRVKFGISAPPDVPIVRQELIRDVEDWTAQNITENQDNVR